MHPPKQLKLEILKDMDSPCDLAIPLPGICRKEMKTCPCEDLYMIFIETLLVIIKRERNNPNVHQQVRDSLWYIYSLEYYLQNKWNKVLTYITPWIKVGNMLSEGRQMKRLGIVWFHLHEILEKKNLIESDRKQVSICLGPRKWEIDRKWASLRLNRQTIS